MSKSTQVVVTIEYDEQDGTEVPWTLTVDPLSATLPVILADWLASRLTLNMARL